MTAAQLLCLQHHFGTILTIFAKFKYYFDFDILAITLQEMKNYVPFQSSLNSIAYFSFFGVRNAIAMKIFSCFSLPKFDLLLFYLIERRASATYNILQANWVVFGWILDKCWENSHTFVGVCDIYLENSLLNFYFGCDIKKTITVYIPTHLVIPFISNHPSFTNCSRVRICFILLLQKKFSQNGCCKKLIFYLNWNHQHICKEYSQTLNTHLLLPM